MFSSHYRWMCLALSVLPLVGLAAGCRSQGRDLPEVPKDDVGTGGGGDAGDGAGGEGGDGVGPKIMGYQYFFRYSYSILQGKYSDEQVNGSVGLSTSLDDVTMTGSRHTLEHYPVVIDNFPRSQYGYALIELRNETTDRAYWTKHQTGIVLMGFVLPKLRLLAPVFGLHMEFNNIDLSDPDSPEVSKSDIRALVVGANFRQKVWGTGEWFAAYYTGRVHLLNVGGANSGWEGELGVGSSFQLGFFRTDATIGYIEQRYRGKRPTGDGYAGSLSVSSRYQSTYMMMTLWI